LQDFIFFDKIKRYIFEDNQYIMTTAILKNEIAKAIDNINDKSFLEALYTIINTRAETYDYELNDADKKVLDERKDEYKSGKAKTYSMSEVRKKVMKNLSA
jgi:hypothetical protein